MPQYWVSTGKWNLKDAVVTLEGYMNWTGSGKWVTALLTCHTCDTYIPDQIQNLCYEKVDKLEEPGRENGNVSDLGLHLLSRYTRIRLFAGI